jgi:hypothetical protein
MLIKTAQPPKPCRNQAGSGARVLLRSWKAAGPRRILRLLRCLSFLDSFCIRNRDEGLNGVVRICKVWRLTMCSIGSIKMRSQISEGTLVQAQYGISLVNLSCTMHNPHALSAVH